MGQDKGPRMLSEGEAHQVREVQSREVGVQHHEARK